MQCDEVEEMILGRLVDDPHLVEAIESHRRECEACDLRFGSVFDLVGLGARVPWHELPAGFDARFRERLKECGPYPGAEHGAGLLQFLFALGQRGYSWVLLLVPSVGLTLAIAHSLHAPAGPLVDVSTPDLGPVLLVMLLGVLVPAAAMLQRVTREQRS
jgi:hypothetical protein